MGQIVTFNVTIELSVIRKVGTCTCHACSTTVLGLDVELGLCKVA